MTFDAQLFEGFNSFLLAAAVAKPVAAPSTPGNLFDGFVIVMLIIGMIRGKMRGMSEELLDVFEWLLVVVVAAHAYKPIGDWVANFAKIPVVLAYVGSYLFVVIVITSIFATVKRKMGEKVFESDLFGGAEYPLGMLGGMVRYGCMVMMLLAILNAFVLDYSQVEIKRKAQEKDLGEGMSFPTKESLHQGIFIGSIVGQFARNNLETQMIEPRAYVPNTSAPPDLPSKEREKAVNDAAYGTPKK
jgi:uncharacterized membrane protein required for colicin V production